MDVTLLAPELALATWGTLILLIDAVLPRGASRRPLLYVSLVGVAIAAGLSVRSEERRVGKECRL